MAERLRLGLIFGGRSVEHAVSVVSAQQVIAAPVHNGVPGEGMAGLAESVGRPKFATVAGLVLYGADRYEETGDGGSTLTSGLVSKVGSWLKEFF